MIEINLVPDIKQELLKAQRIRSAVISISVIAGVASIAVVVLLAIYVFGIQFGRGALSDNIIKNESNKLSKVADISNTLTIQNQLAVLPELHDQKHADSRIFDVLTAINPKDPNNIAINKMTLDSEDSTITLEAQAANGYPALEVFKKTINATKFQYTEDGQTAAVPLATDLSDADRSYGEDTSGKKVLRFTLMFTYPEELFTNNITSPKVLAPDKTNVTDSFLGVPKSLFEQRANDPEENN